MNDSAQTAGKDNDSLNAQIRQQVVETLRSLVAQGLTTGTSGNVSARVEGGMLVTPTGIHPEQMRPEHIVHMALDGTVAAQQLTPSSEWRMHADVYRHKPGINAVVHCHSNYATMMACAHKPIPAQHYMIAATGSYEIPVADYATFGSQALSDASLKALSTSMACLLANHGQLALGLNLDGALKLAALVEEQAFWYWGVLAIGAPRLLQRQQMDAVLEAFVTYGQQEKDREQKDQ
ncbi:class II aldolase [Exilibacterium tricleocarpae]|uniref:Class II aldolase n=1 Tax=Exilibacterium tricleocarpae TaxID=2591008 RepID=A0A545TV95_9GAMM|nr:class II aldolase/adducin family protein [Exilibacterium tricleocarpae]TQV81145.1 class II aldolase [Exilibacterium tricleocarpae]